MDALVAMNQNMTGLLSPTPQTRNEVSSTLAQPTAARVEDGTGTRDAPSSELDRDAFLELLVLQLQNQDPLEPTNNEDMIAQLAQFSALEQMENLNESFEVLSGNVDQLNFITASSMVGKFVAGVDINGTPHQGIVESVGLEGSVVVLNVGGTAMSMAGIADIREPVDGDAGAG